MLQQPSRSQQTPTTVTKKNKKEFSFGHMMWWPPLPPCRRSDNACAHIHSDIDAEALRECRSICFASCNHRDSKIIITSYSNASFSVLFFIYCFICLLCFFLIIITTNACLSLFVCKGVQAKTDAFSSEWCAWLYESILIKQKYFFTADNTYMLKSRESANALTTRSRRGLETLLVVDWHSHSCKWSFFTHCIICVRVWMKHLQ